MDVKKNPWMVHLKKIIKRNPGKNLKQHLLIAKQSYKKKNKKIENRCFKQIRKFLIYIMRCAECNAYYNENDKRNENDMIEIFYISFVRKNVFIYI